MSQNWFFAGRSKTLIIGGEKKAPLLQCSTILNTLRPRLAPQYLVFQRGKRTGTGNAHYAPPAPGLMAMTGHHYERGYPGISGISYIFPSYKFPPGQGDFPCSTLYNQIRLGSSLTAPHQNTGGTDQPRRRMFGLLLILPGLLSAAPATLHYVAILY